MRLAVFTELYPPSIGGQEFFFAGICAQLVRHGHSVDVYCVRDDAAAPAREIVAGVTIIRSPLAPDYKRPRWPATRRSVRAMWRYALSTRRAARSGQYDAFVLNQWPLLHAVLLPAAARRRTVLHWCEFRTGRLNRLIQTFLPRHVRQNAAISTGVASQLQAMCGRDFALLPSGVALDEYDCLPRAERDGILVLGRLAPHKNIPFLIAAYERLRERGYAGPLTIAGDGPAAAEIAARAAASPYAADIHRPGRISEAAKIALLARHELLAMPSEREGFPRVVAEAMASGLPVITVDLPQNGTRDVVRQAACGVVTPFDEAAFVDGMQAVLGDWERFSARGLEQSKALDWGRIASELERLLAQLVDEPAVSRAHAE